MKLVCTLLVAIAPLAAADKPAATAKSQSPVRAKTAPKTEIPVGAIKAADGTWRFTDPAGKKWVYRRTPFGIARMEDDGKPVASPEASSQPGTADRAEGTVKAVEDGDTVRFERAGPFGVYRWDRKKSELTQAERGWLNSARNDSRAVSTQE